MTDPIWWFFLTWLPMYLTDRYHLNIASFGKPLVVIYVMADLGSIAGGWISSSLIRNGKSVNSARKIAMLICAICVLPLMIVAHGVSLWTAILLIGLAAAAHQGWSANLFTLVSDTFPRRAVGSVVGIGGLLGSVGGALFQPLVGKILDVTHNQYVIPFVIASCAYVVALVIIHLLVPRLTPANLS
jgi:ACS family hexuronate transporter-like MFS transporter